MAGPYLSIKELLSAPTGIEWSSIPKKGATSQQQAAEVLRIIRRATAQITSHCKQKLWATTDVEIADIPSRAAIVDEYGSLLVYHVGSPIIAVDLVEFSDDSVNWRTVSGTPIIHRGAGRVPAYFEYRGSDLNWNSRGTVRVTLRTGYPNAVLTAIAHVNDVVLHIDDPTGVAIGDTLTVYDDADQEDVNVAATYVSGSTSVPLTVPLLYDHAVGIAVSEMDEVIREAAIMWASDLVRQRGKDSVVVAPAGGARVISASESSKIKDAKETLNPWRRLM